MALKYTKDVIKHFKNPVNVGEIKNPDAQATEGSPACGDMMKVTMKIDKKTHKIKDIKFKSYGCASNIATASVITKLAKGKTIEEAKKLKWDTAAKELGNLPPVKMHCSVLAVNTIKAAIKNYEIKQGLVKDGEKKSTEELIMEELKHVINPEIGINIVRLKMVKSVKVDKGAVTVNISLGNTDNMYSESIKEEIEEHIKELPKVKKVVVKIK